MPAAMGRLEELLAKQGAGASGPRDMRIDGLLMPSAATPELIEEIDRAGPFGQGAPAPRFAFADMAISGARRVGESHLRFSFSDGFGKRLDAIAFGAFDTDLGSALESAGIERFHLTGKLEINSWGGRNKVQLRLDDAAKA